MGTDGAVEGNCQGIFIREQISQNRCSMTFADKQLKMRVNWRVAEIGRNAKYKKIACANNKMTFGAHDEASTDADRQAA